MKSLPEGHLANWRQSPPMQSARHCNSLFAECSAASTLLLQGQAIPTKEEVSVLVRDRNEKHPFIFEPPRLENRDADGSSPREEQPKVIEQEDGEKLEAA
ncbi:uncharacterized protein PHA67_001364 isoform 1-T1 [Liasis olivaceus]